MAVSLAEKLGPKQGLLAFSLHPGTIMNTSLGNHIDWAVDYGTLRESRPDRCPPLLISIQEAVDRAMGNSEGWADFKLTTLEEGAATHVYASFEPSLKGKFQSSCYQRASKHQEYLLTWPVSPQRSILARFARGRPLDGHREAMGHEQHRSGKTVETK